MRARRSSLLLLSALFALPLVLAAAGARAGEDDSPYVERRKPGH